MPDRPFCSFPRFPSHRAFAPGPPPPADRPQGCLPFSARLTHLLLPNGRLFRIILSTIWSADWELSLRAKGRYRTST